jgi:hypothetical protein
VKLGIKEKRQEKGEDNKKTCRTRNEKKTGKNICSWEKKIQRQSGKCRGEETDRMDRRKWMGSVEQEQTTGRRRRMDIRREQGGNSGRLWNSERRSLGESRRIKNRRESRVEPSRSRFEEAKEKEKTEKEKSGDRNETVYFYFFGIAVLYSEKM